MKRILYLILITLLTGTSEIHAQRHTIRRDGRVLAHSLKFNPEQPTDDMPVALRELLRGYEMQTTRYAERTKGRAVAPLMKSVRHQHNPHNQSCPYYTDENGQQSKERCVVGCVATCLEQMLTYYHYPQTLADTLHGWETEHYALQDVLPGTKIDWENIRNDYRSEYTEAEAKAVADLSLYCGMAVRMNYGVSSSSASLGRAFEPLQRVFGYQTVIYLSRAMYSTPRWNAMLRNELENGRPICYTGHNMELTGHAFNIDGVDEEGYYHVNWGEGGDYDGYFDLDYLNPFEQPDAATPLGQHNGLFSNHTAMFLHPDDLEIEVEDTLTTEDAFWGVSVDEINFRRQPDNQGYVTADFRMTNNTKDSLNFTFEVLTFLPTDTAVFEQADYVGLSAVNLAPGESKTWPVYCHFNKTGERILSFSSDDETLPYQMTINIVEGTEPILRFGDVEHQLYWYDDNKLMANFSLEISNLAETGCAGNLVTFCLFPEGSDIDQRHWEVMSIPAGETQRLSTRFGNLNDGETYSLWVRSPWTVKKTYSFKVNKEEATGIVNVKCRDEENLLSSKTFDLSGRQISTLPIRSVVIRNGRKIVNSK